MADRYRVAELLGLGREEEARRLNDALNQIDTAFGFPAQPMPQPTRSVQGLITADASKVTPGEFLERVLHPAMLPERADLTPKELPNGRLQVAA